MPIKRHTKQNNTFLILIIHLKVKHASLRGRPLILTAKFGRISWILYALNIEIYAILINLKIAAAIGTEDAWHHLIPLVAVVGGTADTKSAVDDFVKWKRIKSLACVIDSSERSDYLRFMFTLPYVRYSLFEFFSSTKISEFPDICRHWIIYCYPMIYFLVKL